MMMKRPPRRLTTTTIGRVPPRRPSRQPRRRPLLGFTLVELMIAVAVLLVVILAISRIFSTASEITSIGEATNDVVQEVAALEQQMRDDFQRLSPEGFFAIRCTALRNDMYVPIGGPLLNPVLPDDAIIRADQLIFFTNGMATTQTYSTGQGNRRRQQSTAARVYYGHGFQLPQAEVYDVPTDADWTLANGEPLTPWVLDVAGQSLPMIQYSDCSAETDPVTPSSVPEIDASQPPATQWLFLRQAVLLADDDEEDIGGPGAGNGHERKLDFLGRENSTWWIYDKRIRDNRVDIAASQLSEIKRSIVFENNFDSSDGVRPWWLDGAIDQRDRIGQAFFSEGALPDFNPVGYPRAERVPPTMCREDQGLANHVLGSAVSNFRIEWTYRDGDSEIIVPTRPDDPAFDSTNPLLEQPWFGLQVHELDANVVGQDPSVRSLWGWVRNDILPQDFEDNLDPDLWPTQNGVEYIENIEQFGTVPPVDGSPYYVYDAFFGYDRQLTPWPSAIRVTMTVHDPHATLERGREVQFVIDLPQRVRQPEAEPSP